MPWGVAAAAVVGAGASMYSANQAEIAGREAQNQQEAMQQEAMDREYQMFQESLALQEPYREAGYQALAGLQALTDPTMRAEQLANYYASPEYQQMAQQAQQSTLSSQSATGRLRGGSSYAELEKIAPTLGQNYLTSQYNQLTGLANLGMGAASQGAAGYQSLGANQAQILGDIGQGRAQQTVAGQQAMNQGLQSAANILGSAAGYYYG